LENSRIILGIDPGSNLMGYGIIRAEKKTPLLLEMDVFNMSKLKGHFNKLARIFELTDELIKKFNPNELAIEAPFYGKNIQSMLMLGRAQGVAIAAALSNDLPIYEYAPRKIKMSITGQGNASKEQVAMILQKILNFKDMPSKLDATDGLSVAVCHYYQNNITKTTPAFKSWKDFIIHNPGRIKKL